MFSFDINLLSTESLEKVYEFCQNENNISNKFKDTNTLWNILYLRKLINKSVNYTNRSSKHQSYFNYVILNKEPSKNKQYTFNIDNVNNILCNFSIKIISKPSELTNNEYFVYEMTVILNKNLDISVEQYIFNKIKEQIIDLHNDYNRIAIKDKKRGVLNTLVVLYVNNDFHNKNKEWFVENQLYYGIEDKYNYDEPFKVYYYLYREQDQDQNGNDSVNNVISSKILNECVDIIDNLYFITDSKEYAMNRMKGKMSSSLKLTKQISTKITRKRSYSLEKSCKSVLKYIWEIPEIIDRPEYNFDFSFRHMLSYIYFYNVNMDKMNQYSIKNSFFQEPKIFNELLLENYEKIFNLFYHLYEHNKSNKYNSKLLFNMNVIKADNKLSRFNNFINTNIIRNIINKGNTSDRLIITNSTNDLNIVNHLDKIILIKQQLNKIKDIVNALNKNISINIAYNLSEFNVAIKKSNNKFNYIYINTMYLNYDYLLSSINLLVKLPYFMYIVLNSLKVLKNNGNLDVIFYYSNLEIPSIKKLFSLLITSFNEYDIKFIHLNNIVFISFKKFKGLKSKLLKIIDCMIINAEQNKDNEFELNDIALCMRANKYYYKLDNYNNYKLEPIIDIDKQIKKKIIYNFDINITYSTIELKKINDFYKKYNKYNDIIFKYIKNNYIDITKLTQNEIEHKLKTNYINIVNHLIIIILYYINQYKIIEDNTIQRIITPYLSKYNNNIDTYIENIKFIK
jgi:hypothetical protein